MPKKQTRTIHVFDGEVDLSDVEGVTVAARNDRWTTCVPKAPNTFDAVPISGEMGGDGVYVWDQWFIEGEGIVARMYNHGIVIGVFAFPNRDGAGTAKDLAEVLDLNEDMATSKQVKELKKLAKDQKALAKWTLDHGLEKLLGLPEVPEKAPAKAAKPATKPAAKKKAAAKPKKKAKATPRRLR